ncbi:MAG: DUF507 family protein [Bdellovibrionaceae bacterium]|nr:DUF507 family protein [Pseudobdellovibrionaceae bacterium]
MKFSADRQSYISHKLTDLLLNKSLVKSPSKEILFEHIKGSISFFVQEWEEMEQKVLKKIQSIKRGIRPGSSEWDILYNRFLEESFRKKSRLFVKK